MSDENKNWIKYFFYALLVVGFYVLLVYSYFQFEQFSPSKPDATLKDALWYVFLNPTGLGNAGNFMTYPSTLIGKIISIIFVLTGLGLLGTFIGKIGDMFSEYREYHRLGHAGTNFTDHMVIIGWNDFTRLITNELIKSNRKVAVITQDRESIDLIYDQFSKSSVFVLFADLKNYDMFEKANINLASRVLVSPRSDTDTLVTLLNIKERYENPDYVVTIKNEELVNTFEGSEKENDEQLARYAIPPYETASGLMASNIFEPDSAEYLSDLITSVPQDDDDNSSEEHEFQQYRITPNHPFSGKKYIDVFNTLYEEYSCPSIGISKSQDNESSKRNFIKLPEDDVTVESGDYIVLIVSSTNIDEIQKFFGVEQGLDL